jgi:CoA:oxalate CoA-transferase
MTSEQVASEHQRPGPLAGLRVIDLTHMLAGPYCTWLLGSLGAEITKVEQPGHGDFTRGIAPFADDQSIYFMSVNRNKRSVTLNLKHPSGRDVLLRMVRHADVFVENNRPGAMARLGLSYAELANINPRLIYASVSGFGQTGPYCRRPAFDAVVQAMSGMMSITGEENGPPARVGASIGDIGASLFSTIGILSALTDRNITGSGAHVDVAMFDAQLALLENAIARYLNAGIRPGRLGSRHPLIAPFQAFPTRDEPIVICLDTEAQWKRFCDVIGRSDLAANPLFADGSSRAHHHAKLEPELICVLSRKTRAEWFAAFDAAEIPAGPINDIPAVVKDPQVAARQMIRKSGNCQFVDQPIHFSSYTELPNEPAPKFGQDTHQVLVQFGYSPEEIAAMKAQGAI